MDRNFRKSSCSCRKLDCCLGCVVEDPTMRRESNSPNSELLHIIDVRGGQKCWKYFFLSSYLVEETELNLQMKGTSVQSWVGSRKVRVDQSSLSWVFILNRTYRLLKMKCGTTTWKCGLFYNYRCMFSFKDIYIPTSHIVDRTDSGCLAISNGLNSQRYHWEIYKALLWLLSGQSYKVIVPLPKV